MRKAREARAKLKSETEERERGWSGAKARDKAYISRLVD